MEAPKAVVEIHHWAYPWA